MRARAVARARPLSAQVVQVQVVRKPSAVLCSSPQCTATNSALTMYLDPLHSALILPISVRSWTTIEAAATGILKRWDNHLSGSLTNCSNGMGAKTPAGDEEYIYHIDIYTEN